LEELLAVAQRDTGQSRKVANFLLAWWYAAENGGFDLMCRNFKIPTHGEEAEKEQVLPPPTQSSGRPN
jgi:hypothetical protein